MDKFKPNYNAAMSYNGKTTCGRALRDHCGGTIFTFFVRIGNSSINLAELWAIVFGIKLATSRGYV